MINILLVTIAMSLSGYVVAAPPCCQDDPTHPQCEVCLDPSIDTLVPHLNDRFDIFCASTARNVITGKEVEYARVQLNDINWTQHVILWGPIVEQTIGQSMAIGAVIAVEGLSQPIITPNEYSPANNGVILPGTGGKVGTMQEFRDVIRSRSVLRD